MPVDGLSVGGQELGQANLVGAGAGLGVWGIGLEPGQSSRGGGAGGGRSQGLGCRV